MISNNKRYDVEKAYRQMFVEDAPNPPTSSAENAPTGAMSSEPYMAQMDDNPKLAIYNHQTKKKKIFTRQEDLDEFLKENPDWSVEPIEESKLSDRIKVLEKTVLTFLRQTVDRAEQAEVNLQAQGWNGSTHDLIKRIHKDSMQLLKDIDKKS